MPGCLAGTGGGGAGGLDAPLARPGRGGGNDGDVTGGGGTNLGPSKGGGTLNFWGARLT
jgi:hypothetical protein